MKRGGARRAAAAAVVAVTACGYGCLKRAPAPAPNPDNAARTAPAAVPEAAGAFQQPSRDEIAAARLGGFPVGFEECQKMVGTHSGVWTCGFKKASPVAHDPELRACAPLLGQEAADDHNLGRCHLVYWDSAAKLPVDFQDCKRRFIDEPGVVHARGEDLCVVQVSLLDGDLFEACRRMPFAEVKEGFCRYPLAGLDWKPRQKSSPWTAARP